MFDIQNRRYTGNKYKLMEWIENLIDEHCVDCHSLFDVFAGTGSVTDYLMHKYDRLILNDFLYSNNIIYNGFFLNEKYDDQKLNRYVEIYNNYDKISLTENYFSNNFGEKYFCNEDAKLIGFIRDDIEKKYTQKELNKKEYSILVSSLIYSMDRIANTVGHYEAYIKGKTIKGKFVFSLINPKQLKKNQIVEIYREDSNNLAKKIKADIAFIDPPYNSRQYSRFYHVLETVTKWDKPKLFGTAMKPEPENISDYCKTSAPKAFEDLVRKLDSKYIVVTYNNTYTSKSSSSKNKISLEEIEKILLMKGETKKFEKKYKAFNSGKTELPEHKEYVFITKVFSEKKSKIRSPFLYVGDKYKLMPQIKTMLPNKIEKYIEPFVGGGSPFLNILADEYYVNDIDQYIIKLHKALFKYANNEEELFETLFEKIDYYGLSCSYKGKSVPDELKKKHIKTYYAKYNKEAYIRMRKDFNFNKENMILLYLLLIYGFNHMIRFNSTGEFNLPVGNVDFNKNVYESLSSYLSFVRRNKIKFYNLDYKDFLKKIDIKENDYIFFDPPYLISMSEYNKLWNEEKEKELYDYLDKLDRMNVKFGITNLISHKGKTNSIFLEWSKKYFTYSINSNYISFNDNSIKSNSKEVYVTNYDKNKKC